jgi:hypothetical protein
MHTLVIIKRSYFSCTDPVQIDRFIRLIYTSAKQRESGEVPALERAGVIKDWLQNDNNDVKPELLSKEVRSIVAAADTYLAFSWLLKHDANRSWTLS